MGMRERLQNLNTAGHSAAENQPAREEMMISMKYSQTRRRLGVAAGLAVLTATGTACSGGTSVGGSSSQAATSGKPQGTIRLSYCVAGKRAVMTNGVFLLFAKAN